MEEEEENGERSYKSLGLSDEACKAIERIRGGHPPDRFLIKALPYLISGGDFRCLIADRLRSFKIATYMVTMMDKFKKHRGTHLAGKPGIRALILTATTDMAAVIFDRAKRHFGTPDIVIALLDGGESDLRRLALGRKRPVAVIATPDTLIRHLSAAAAADGIMSLRTVEFLVIDGAYHILRLGVADHLNQILGHLGEDRQTLLFTTEMTAEVRVLANKFLLPQHKLVMQSRKYAMMMEKISSLAIGQEQQPGVGVGKPNNLQGSCPPPLFNAKKKKRATPDWMEEAGRFKKRAEISMDID